MHFIFRFLIIADESIDKNINNSGSTQFCNNSKNNSNQSIGQKSSYKESSSYFQDKTNSVSHNNIHNSNSNFDNIFTGNTFSPVHHSSSTQLHESSTSVYFSTPTDHRKKNNSTLNKSYSKSQKSCINFGDYMQNVSSTKKSSNKCRSINTSNDNTCSIDTSENSYLKDFTSTPEINKSNQNFPALGDTHSSHKSNPRFNRSKRIKPTSLNFSTTENDCTKSTFNDTSERQINSISNNSFHMERSILRNEKDFIKKQFENSKHIKTVFINPQERSLIIKTSEPGDISLVTHKKELDILANIYNVILNNNLLSNFLSEISYVLSLLNVEKTDIVIDDSDFFSSFHNCIYFCIKILQEQKQFFILLDIDTLRPLSDNKRIQYFNAKLSNFLRCILKQKNLCFTPIDSGPTDKNNVCFQSETDNRGNFTSDQTFRAFRKQRDLFYDMLRFAKYINQLL